MKCPKCGYNSFETQDTCNKCSNDLSAFKLTYGLKPIVFPQETRLAMAAALAVENVPVAGEQPAAEQPGDMFSFDLPEEAPTVAGTKIIETEDFFSFKEQPAAPAPAGDVSFSFDDDIDAKRNKSVEDAFASLLESSGDTPFAAAKPAIKAPPAPAANIPGEFDLENFSWDETPEIKSQDKPKPDEDFNSLFGELDGTAKK